MNYIPKSGIVSQLRVYTISSKGAFRKLHLFVSRFFGGMDFFPDVHHLTRQSPIEFDTPLSCGLAWSEAAKGLPFFAHQHLELRSKRRKPHSEDLRYFQSHQTSLCSTLFLRGWCPGKDPFFMQWFRIIQLIRFFLGGSRSIGLPFRSGFPLAFKKFWD